LFLYELKYTRVCPSQIWQGCAPHKIPQWYNIIPGKQFAMRCISSALALGKFFGKSMFLGAFIEVSGQVSGDVNLVCLLLSTDVEEFCSCYWMDWVIEFDNLICRWENKRNRVKLCFGFLKTFQNKRIKQQIKHKQIEKGRENKHTKILYWFSSQVESTPVPLHFQGNSR
jgi:hypothetical protein